jgi:hypothetical protein
MWAVFLVMLVFGYAVAWVDRKLRPRLPFPRDLAALAVERAWCLEALRAGGALPRSAEVHDYRVRPLGEQLSFRSDCGTVAVEYSDGGERHTLTCFAKFAPTMGSVWNRFIFNIQLNHIKEVTFNAHFIPVDAAVAAPKVYFARVEPVSGNLCLITEFLSECTEYLECDEVRRDHLELALAGMAALHARYWSDGSARMRKILPITDGTVFWFESLVAWRWSAAARRILTRSWLRMNEAQTIIHGDARVGNMLFPTPEGAGRFVFIDWQAVRKGKAAFDLAYFLVLSLSTETRRAVEREAIDRYHHLLVAQGVSGYSRADLEEDYRHASLCVLVLLSLPLLSGEASVEGEGAHVLAFGMGLWRERLRAKLGELDDAWLSDRYQVTAADGRRAVADALGVIEERMRLLTAAVPPRS